MKKMVIITAALLMLTASVFSQGANIDQALEAYNQTLKNGNIGLRSSALYCIAQVKAQYPETDFTAVQKTLKKVSRSDKSVMVKVQANLIAKYIQNDELVDAVVPANDNQVLFFDQLYDAVMANEITTIAWK